MRNRIRQTIADSLDLPVDKIGEDASPATLAEWDSLKHLDLMLALEAEFGKRISSEEMVRLQSLQLIEEFLSR